MWFHDLPDGARITKITVYYMDFDPAHDIRFAATFAGTGNGGGDYGNFEAMDHSSTYDTQPSGPYNGMWATALTFPTSANPIVVDRHSPIVPSDGPSANREYGVVAVFGSVPTTGEEGNVLLSLDGVSVDYIPPN